MTLLSALAGTTDLGPRINTRIPNLARMYDYYLGGHHNFPPDRERARMVQSVLPCNNMLARSNRAFLRRAVRMMTDLGVEQFLDLGSGLPTATAVHDVAREVNPEARVVYVDNDPVAVAHGELILTDVPLTATIEADFREPDAVLDHPRVRELLDFDEPIGVSMTGVLVFVRDDEDPARLVAAYRSACTPGSYLAISHLTDDEADPLTREQVRAMVGVYESVNRVLQVRDRATFTSWFDGLSLVEPGVSLLTEWRPDAEAAEIAETEARELGIGAVGRVW